MRKFLVRLFNLLYLAASAVAIWAICTKPVFNATLKLDMTPEKLGEVLQPLFNNATKSSTRSVVTRDTTTKKEITDYITVERIADAFRDPEHPENDGLHISVPLTIEAKYAFDFKNKQIINELVIEKIDTIVSSTANTLSGPLQNFIFSITQEFAVDALTTALNNQIAQSIGDGSEVTPQQVEEVYQNVFNALDNNEGEIPLSDLTHVIIYGTDENPTSALSILNERSATEYEACPEGHPTAEEYAVSPTSYFVYDSEQQKYVNTEAFDSEAAYFTVKYLACPEGHPTAQEYAVSPTSYFVYDSEQQKYVNTEEYDDTASYFTLKKIYTEEDLNRIDIEGQMESALSEVPGLVETSYVLYSELNPGKTVSDDMFTASLRSTQYFVNSSNTYAAANVEDFALHRELWIKNTESSDPAYVVAPTYPTEEEYTATLQSIEYFVKDGEEYKAAKTYSSETEYYVAQSRVKDIDTALTALINLYLLKKDGGSSGENTEASAIRRSRAVSLGNSKSRAELIAALKEFAYKYIPIDRVSGINDQYGKYVPIALAGIVALVAFPWALFALVTLIRTFRKKKIWTKPSIINILAFPQLIFGIIITYGLPYGLEMLAGKFEIIHKILDAGVSLQLTNLCLTPSFIYCGVFVSSIIYVFFAHELKASYKFEKRMMAMYRSGGRRRRVRRRRPVRRPYQK